MIEYRDAQITQLTQLLNQFSTCCTLSVSYTRYLYALCICSFSEGAQRSFMYARTPRQLSASASYSLGSSCTSRTIMRCLINMQHVAFLRRDVLALMIKAGGVWCVTCSGVQWPRALWISRERLSYVIPREDSVEMIFWCLGIPIYFEWCPTVSAQRGARRCDAVTGL